MATKSLAIKYRPTTFDDVTEQGAVRIILQQQLKSNSVMHAYLFCGGAGTGKTTCARIFANEINNGHGNPIEMDAASNNSVDDVRDIIQQSKVKSLDSEYKIFIIDECHALSNTAWQAMLKLIEEPPAKSIFIFCTTDPQKIPKTILSRVQRYDFQRISHEGICRRLELIYQTEAVDNNWKCDYNYKDAMEYIAKIADGGMRDAITLMDKCLAYSTDLTLDNVIKALGAVDYYTMFNLTNCILDNDLAGIIQIIEDIHMSGMDIKQFVRSYMLFMLDLEKYYCTKSFEFVQMPETYEHEICKYTDNDFDTCMHVLDCVTKLNANIKWDTSPKACVEAELILLADTIHND